MLLMVVVGVPMYICSTSSIPVAVALMAAGISPGAAYVFLVAGPATNAATLAILKRMLGLRHVLLYLATIIIGALLFGPLVNLVFAVGGWEPVAASAAETESHGLGPIEYMSGAALALMLAAFFYRSLRSKLRRRDMEAGGEAEGTRSVTVDLKNGTARVHGNADKDALGSAVAAEGYLVK